MRRNRIADVVDALYDAGFPQMTVIDVESLLQALDSREQRCSVGIDG